MNYLTTIGQILQLLVTYGPEIADIVTAVTNLFKTQPATFVQAKLSDLAASTKLASATKSLEPIKDFIARLEAK
jgi:hypothetical protein